MPNRVPAGVKPRRSNLRRRRGKNFSGSNPVQQRAIGVNPSQGGFFSVPSDERNFGQQSALPYQQQLNVNGCGYSNFTHSNFTRGGNQNAIWSGAQTNVGPQDRIYAGNYANGRRRR
jgi:hypothetical protein